LNDPKASVDAWSYDKSSSAGKIDPATEADIRAALCNGDTGIRKIALQLGVATWTAQRIKAG